MTVIGDDSDSGEVVMVTGVTVTWSTFSCTELT